MPKLEALARVPTPEVREQTPPLPQGISIRLKRPRCFRSDERLRCADSSCRWWAECRRLVAEWRR